MKKIMLAFAFLAFATAAGATDFTAKILDDDGKPMCVVTVEAGVCSKPFTVGLAVRNALDAQANTQGITPQEKDRRGELGQGLIGATNPTLLESDKKMIRDTVGNAYPPSIVHKLWTLLDAKPAEKSDKK